VFLRFVVDVAGSEESPAGSGFVKLSQNTAEAEELSLLLLNLRLFAEPSGWCDSRLKFDEPVGRKSIYDFVARNRLLLFGPIENFSKFLSFKLEIELIFDMIFMFGVFCKLFKLSNECFEMRDDCLSVDAFDKKLPPSLLLSPEFAPLGASSVKISDIFCEKE
jgi:hypothetical protein